MEQVTEALNKAEKSSLNRIAVSSNYNEYQKLSDEEQSRLRCELFNTSQGDLQGYDCEKCKNKGLVMTSRQTPAGYWSEFATPCSCMNIREIYRKLEKSGLKDVISAATFDKFEVSEDWQKVAKKTAETFADNSGNGGWFFIGGSTGAGKTHLCTAICGKMLKKQKNVKYFLWREDITALKAVVTESDEYSRRINELKTVDVLYIDDLFKNGRGYDGQVTPPTAADINIAFEVINSRYMAKDKITIISSERTVDELIKIDEAVAGRIIQRASESNSILTIRGDGKNYRLRGVTEL